MTIRALIVLLAVLNLGVAAWWIWHPQPPPAVSETETSGIARLRLLNEPTTPKKPFRPAPSGLASRPETSKPDASKSATPGPLAADTTPAKPITETAPVDARCFRIGPFADEKALAKAQTELWPNAQRLRTRETRSGEDRGWRVYLPPAADRAAADALVVRLRAAGFEDLNQVNEGAEANSIALGRFGTETRARAHAESVRAAGFEARVESLGTARVERWVELAANDGFDPAAARRLGQGVEARPADCAAIR